MGLNAKNWKRFAAAPMKLRDNRVYRIYRGGAMIDRLKGRPPGEDGFLPEEWIGSTTLARNPGREHIRDEGLSVVEGPDGETATLARVIEALPHPMLGRGHAKRNGRELGLLVKLLDAAERLPIQSHPDKRFARERLGSEFGKTESWIILGLRRDGPEPPYILFGFNETADPDRFARAVADQDIEAMTAMLNKVPVRPGECYLIPGRLPHAIGAGVFMVEVQEPTDFTISHEKTVGELRLSDETAFCGLGPEAAVEALDFQGPRGAEVIHRFRIEPRIVRQDKGAFVRRVFGPDETDCFGVEYLDVFKGLVYETPGPYVGIVVGGSGWLRWKSGYIPIKAGESFFAPAALRAHKYETESDLRVIACFPPGGLSTGA